MSLIACSCEVYTYTTYSFIIIAKNRRRPYISNSVQYGRLLFTERQDITPRSRVAAGVFIHLPHQLCLAAAAAAACILNLYTVVNHI